MTASTQLSPGNQASNVPDAAIHPDGAHGSFAAPPAAAGATKRPRPIHRNIHVADIVTYRLPPAGVVSILHRVSGALMFLLLPFILWLFDKSLASRESFEQLASVLATGAGALPGWFLKLMVLSLIWAYLLHLTAGVRHLWMDITHSVGKAFGHRSAIVTLGLSTVLTLALGFKLFF